MQANSHFAGQETLTDEAQRVLEPVDLERSLGAEELKRGHKVALSARICWERRQFLLRTTICGLALAVLIAFSMRNRFQSTTRLMPPDNHATPNIAMLAALSGGSGGGLGSVAGELMGLKGSGALFIGILRSRTVEDRIVEEFRLEKAYGARLREDACKELEDNTQISEDRKSGIITIAVRDNQPRLAAAMAQAYVEQLNRLVAELTTSAAHRERVFLEGRLNEVKKDLDAAARDFSEFSSKNAAIDIKEQGRAMVDAAATLQGELIAAQSQLEGLRQVYTDNNVRVHSVRARIAELRKQLDKLGGQDLDQTGDQLYPSIRKLPLLGATYGDLYRRVKIQEAVYETLTKQYELARVEEAKEIPTVRVLDVATIPERKIGPHRVLILLFVTALAFGVGLLWLLAEARWAELPADDYRKFIIQAAVGYVTAPSSSLWYRLRRRTSPPENNVAHNR